MTVRELQLAMGVTTTAVRQQLTRLVREGLAVRTQRQGGTGRPADVFALSERGQGLFGGQSAALCGVLVSELLELAGPARSQEVLQHLSHRLADAARDSVGDGPPAERVRRLAEHLGRNGDLVEAEERERGLTLKLFTCPYGTLPHAHRAICEVERAAFRDIVGGPVELDRSMPEGHSCCEFSVAATPEQEVAAAED